MAARCGWSGITYSSTSTNTVFVIFDISNWGSCILGAAAYNKYGFSKNKNMVKAVQSGFIHRSFLLAFVAGMFVLAMIFRLSSSNAAAVGAAIHSGVSGYCLDDYKDGATDGNQVMLWRCNNSPAQDWVVDGDHIAHERGCLSVQGDRKDPGAPLVVNACKAGPGQIWLRDGKGYYNPASGMCLTAKIPGQQLTVIPCGLAPASDQTWSVASLKPGTQSAACHGTKGELVACYAEQEWSTWQSGTISHAALLNKYTDGTPYEAWCADFVSYVYKEAGYPFSGAYDGWDENNANNIQNYGFAMHPAGSGYVPKPGDIAYFDYNGGHVEIVVGGGKVPTFVYGNAAAIDPGTGNGQMKANAIVSEGSEGHLVYYLSPN